MEKGLRFISFTFFIGVVLAMVSSCVFAQEDGGPHPPPVDIQVSLGSVPKVGEEVEVIIKITPQEDMHADISCLLPTGIKVIREEGVRVRPCMDRELRGREQRVRYTELVELWVGPMKGSVAKEFLFRVVIPDKERYELIARVEALAKWGVKEESFIIDLN